MKSPVQIVFCIFFVIALLAVSCGAPQTEEAVVDPEEATLSNPLVGVWEITGDTIAYPPDMNQETEVNDTHLPGIMVFTKKYLSWVDFHGKSLPALPEDPTDAQVAAVYSQLTALAGTYEINGSSITVPTIVSKDPNETSGGETFNCEYELAGDVLTISFKNAGNDVTLKLKRLE